MNALLYAANTQSQVLLADQTINLGQPVRRYGRNLNMSGGNVIANGEGYYPVWVNVSFNADEAGLAVIQLYDNGVPIPGAKVERSTAADVVYAEVIPAVIRIKCCEERVITATISIDATITNASVLVEKA